MTPTTKAKAAPKKSGSKMKKEKIKAMDLRELLSIKLCALYDVELQLTKAIPKMAKNAANPDLKRGFEHHEKQTEGHVERLERAFDELEMKPKKLQSEAIRGLIADAEWVMKNIRGQAALDANLIAAARYIEHYEMAGYSSAIEWAQSLGMDTIANLLMETFDEEREADEELETLATSEVNEAALGSENDDDKKEDENNDSDFAEEKPSHDDSDNDEEEET